MVHSTQSHSVGSCCHWSYFLLLSVFCYSSKLQCCCIEAFTDMTTVPKRQDMTAVLCLQDTNKVLAISRIMVAWQPLGLAMGTYDMCNRYLQQRQQFGSPLAAFQVKSHLCCRSPLHQAVTFSICMHETCYYCYFASASQAKATAHLHACQLVDRLGGSWDASLMSQSWLHSHHLISAGCSPGKVTPVLPFPTTPGCDLQHMHAWNLLLLLRCLCGTRQSNGKLPFGRLKRQLLRYLSDVSVTGSLPTSGMPVLLLQGWS